MSDPLRFAGLDGAGQEAELRRIVAADPDLMAVLTILRDAGLPDAWLTSGAVYATVWNVLTGKPRGHGIKDYDIIYFDGDDLSWEAEDREIRRVGALMAPLGLPVEIRNQARVHLWYEARFGAVYPKLSRAVESLGFYASETHAVAVRLRNTEIEVAAPFGLGHVFAMRIVPNLALDNARTHAEKAARCRRNWPGVSVVDWPGTCVPG